MLSYFQHHLSGFLTVQILVILFSVNEYIFGQIISVPGDFTSIQAAFNSASDGDTILVGPGTYNESITFDDKAVLLASLFFTSGDDNYISQTILDGNNAEAVIEINDDYIEGTTANIVGFTLQNANNGLYVNDGRANISNCRVTNCTDAIEYREGTGGVCRSNVLEFNSDDGVDLNYDVDIVLEDNIINTNDGDGIEIRIQSYTGPLLSYIIRDNTIENNDNYGIQIIEYGTVTDRIFIIEGNLIINNGEVGVGCISEPKGEPFEDISLPERIYLFGNTFVGNLYGVNGGDSLVALNNIFIDHEVLAMKNSNGGSMISTNICWNNASDFENCNVDFPSILFEDPQLNEQYQLEPASPAVDAGISFFIWHGDTVLNRSQSDYNGDAPDLGALESGSGDDPLPVELLGFNIEYINDNALLSWITESEINNIGFEVLRADNENGDYIILSSYKDNIDLTGKGNSGIRHEYYYMDRTVEPGKIYWYKISDVDFSGVVTYHGSLPFSIPGQDVNPAFKLYLNYPNPFNPSTTIKFEINESVSDAVETRLAIYNSTGRVVRVLNEGKLSSGIYNVKWDGKNMRGSVVSGGTYFARFSAGQYSQTIKMALVK